MFKKTKPWIVQQESRLRFTEWAGCGIDQNEGKFLGLRKLGFVELVINKDLFL